MGLAVSSAMAKVFFEEQFSDGDKWTSRWVESKHKGDEAGEWKLSHGKFYGDEKKDVGLQTAQDARFYQLSAKFGEFSNKGKKLVVQFSVKHEQNIDCGGGYVKLMPKTDSAKFEGSSKYYVMFGPDICGYTKKIHLIFHYKDKNLLWKKEPRCESDQLTHVYTMHLLADGTYAVYVDGEKRESGKLEDDWEFLAPKTIADPSDKKPSDWVDEAEMDDPTDSKPADWDAEPETIPDPDAKQPADWNVEEDGEWEAPNIPNPKHKGAWKAKRIPNPAYKGVWAPKQIPNPDYVEDKDMHVYTDIATVGFDLWQVKAGTIFDDIILTDSLAEADAFRAETWGKHKDAEKAAKEAIDKKAADAAKAAAPPAAAGGDDDGDDDDDETL